MMEIIGHLWIVVSSVVIVVGIYVTARELRGGE